MKTSQLRQLIKEEITKSLSNLDSTTPLKPESPQEVKNILKYLTTTGKSPLLNINNEEELKDILGAIFQGMNPSLKTNTRLNSVLKSLSITINGKFPPLYIAEPPTFLNAIKNLLASSFGYGYWYIREKKGNKLFIHHISTVEDAYDMIGDLNPNSVKIKYPSSSTKVLEVKIETDSKILEGGPISVSFNSGNLSTSSNSTVSTESAEEANWTLPNIPRIISLISSTVIVCSIWCTFVLVNK